MAFYFKRAFIIMAAFSMTLLPLRAGIGAISKSVKNSQVMRTVTIADSASTIKLNIGDTLDVKLTGNPSTGYRWKIDFIDSTILHQVKIHHPIISDKAEHVGEPKIFYFDFVAISSGRTNLRIVYQRSWESDTPPIQIFNIKVEIRK